MVAELQDVADDRPQAQGSGLSTDDYDCDDYQSDKETPAPPVSMLAKWTSL